MNRTTLLTLLACLLWTVGSAQVTPLRYRTGEAAGMPRNTTGIADRNSRMSAKLESIRIHGDVLYFTLFLHNRSHIAFDIDFVRFYIRDRKTAKRTVTQEHELPPLDIHGLEHPRVEGRCGKTVTAALGKFTLADGKLLAIEIYEKGGGRHLYLTVRYHHIENAEPLN
ncbi:DUF4138 domain-containing protein [Parapedobacter sp. DT-150]|uniref:DUF4138 domain-containing protein n=1 Tax=Parapedobacter sp. DT-150 TaxID=3396162 RepID=UPI003F1C1393